MGARNGRKPQIRLICGLGSGAEGARTPDLRIANAALFQLSYCPKSKPGRYALSPDGVKQGGKGPLIPQI